MRGIYEAGRSSRSKAKFAELLSRIEAGDPDILFSGHTAPDYSVNIDMTSSLEAMTLTELRELLGELSDISDDLLMRKPEECDILAYDAWDESMCKVTARMIEVDIAITENLGYEICMQ